jgi:hypothetical protein
VPFSLPETTLDGWQASLSPESAAMVERCEEAVREARRLTRDLGPLVARLRATVEHCRRFREELLSDEVPGPAPR